MRSVFLSEMILVTLTLGLPARAADEPAKTAKPKRPLTSRLDELGGKTFADWIKELKESHDPAVVENALRTILLYDPKLAREAVPIVLDKLRYPGDLDVSVKISMAMFLGQIDLGAHREKAVSKLIALVNTTKQVNVQYFAILALMRLGQDAKAAIPILRTNLWHSSWEIRKVSAEALAAVALPKKDKAVDKDVIESLRKRLLGDPSFIVRLEIVRTLVVLGPPAPAENRKVLRQTLETIAGRERENLSVRIWAHVAAIRIVTKPEDKEVARGVTFIGGQLENPILMVRIEAARALGTLKIMGVDVKSQLKTLVKALGDSNSLMVDAVILALKEVGKPSVALLAYELGSDKMNVRVAAARTLGVIGLPGAETQIQPLVAALSDREPLVVEAAIGALGQMGADAAAAVGPLLEGSNMKLRYAAARVLALIGPDARSQVDRLRATLADSDQALVNLAMLALGRIGKGASPAVPDLQQLGQSKPDLKKAVNAVIGAIRRPPPE